MTDLVGSLLTVLGGQTMEMLPGVWRTLLPLPPTTVLLMVDVRMDSSTEPRPPGVVAVDLFDFLDPVAGPPPRPRFPFTVDLAAAARVSSSLMALSFILAISSFN